MALTGAQTTKVDELQAIIDTLNTDFKNSPTMQNVFGSYMFDTISKINKKITEIRNA